MARFSLASALLLAATAATTAKAACNGHDAYCDWSYSNVSVIGAHNSYAVSAGSLAANQNYTVKTQLDNGIRMLQVQGHMNGNELHLCHTSCALLDGGTFTSYLQTVKSWLDANPQEVITILMVNTDGVSPSTWAESYSASGMDQYAFTPSSVPVAYSDWPTLQDLIGSGKRAVNFLAQGADVSQVPYLLDEFTHMWETPFSQTDSSFPCTVDRVTGSPSGKMYLVNHILNVNITLLGESIPIPDTQRVAQVNAATGSMSLGSQAQTCMSQHGSQKPTFTLVDFYDVGGGSVFQYAASLNGVSYTSRAIGNGSSSSFSGGSSSNGQTTSGGGAVTSSSLNGATSLAGPAAAVLALALLSAALFI